MIAPVLAVFAFAATYALTGAIRNYAIRHSVLDVPNVRSLHSVPTPRGGGLAILAVVAAGLLVLWMAGAPTTLIAALLGAMPIGLIGWFDDHRPIAAWIRILVHVLCALWALAWLGGMPTLMLGTRPVQLGVVGSALALVGIVWTVNLYNFMDGIDGLAGAEAVVVGGFGCLLLFSGGHDLLGSVSLLLCASAGGFLLWNWPPARIFMGDVGSGFIGYMFATLALASEHEHALPLLIWLLLAGVFVVDATITLLRRVWRHERWYEAHKSHAYQRLVRGGWAHAKTTVVAVAVDFGLGALAFAATLDTARSLLYTAIGMLMLVALYLLIERRHPMLASPESLTSEA